jgi:hypothetical protein
MNYDGSKFVLHHREVGCDESSPHPTLFFLQETINFAQLQRPLSKEELHGFGLWIYFLTKHIFLECTEVRPPMTYHIASNMCADLLRIFGANDERLGMILAHLLWGMLRATTASSPPDFSGAYKSHILPPCDSTVLHSCSELMGLVCQNPFETVQVTVTKMFSDLIGYKMKPIKDCNYKSLTLLYRHIKRLNPANVAIRQEINELLEYGERFHTICFIEKAVFITSEETEIERVSNERWSGDSEYSSASIDLQSPLPDAPLTHDPQYLHTVSAPLGDAMIHDFHESANAKDSTIQMAVTQPSVVDEKSVAKSGTAENESPKSKLRKEILVKEAEELIQTVNSSRNYEKLMQRSHEAQHMAMNMITQQEHRVDPQPNIGNPNHEPMPVIANREIETTVVRLDTEKANTFDLFVNQTPPQEPPKQNRYENNLKNARDHLRSSISVTSVSESQLLSADGVNAVEDYVFKEMTVAKENPDNLHNETLPSATVPLIEQDGLRLQDLAVDECLPQLYRVEQFPIVNQSSISSIQSLTRPATSKEGESPSLEIGNSISSIHLDEEQPHNEELEQSSVSVSISNDSQKNAPESIMVAQLSTVSTPFMKKTIQLAIQALLRHLVFSIGAKSINYFDIYSEGLLCGRLHSVAHNREDIAEFEINRGLHPILREVIALDHSLLIELLQDWELPSMSILQDDSVVLFEWIRGLDSLHRHLLPLSKSIVKLEENVKTTISVAQAMILVKDRISIVKLTIQGAFSSENLQRLHSNLSMQNLEKSRSYSYIGKLDSKSRIAGSMLSLPSTILDWIQLLLV